MAQIEMPEPEWRPPEARVVYENLQAEINKAFTVPAYISRPDDYREFHRRAFEATEPMRQELVRLYLTHCFPSVVLIKREEND